MKLNILDDIIHSSTVQCNSACKLLCQCMDGLHDKKLPAFTNLIFKFQGILQNLWHIQFLKVLWVYCKQTHRPIHTFLSVRTCLMPNTADFDGAVWAFGVDGKLPMALEFNSGC